MFTAGLVLLGVTALPVARAVPIDAFGYGAQSIGRGTGGMAMTTDTEGLFVNPAALTHMTAPQLAVGYAAHRFALDPVPDVLWDTNRDGVIDDTDTPLSVQPASEAADGIMIGLGRPIGKRVALGVALWEPAGRIVRIHSFEPSIPTYFMYENRPHTIQLAVGAGVEIGGGLSIGAAVYLGAGAEFHLVGTLSVTASAPEEGEQLGDVVGGAVLDVHELTLDTVPRAAPILSADWDPGQLAPALEGLRIAVGWRGSTRLDIVADVDVQANINVEDVGSLEPMVITALLPISMGVIEHWLPPRISGGIAYSRPRVAGMFDVHRTAWDSLELNIAHVEPTTVETQLLQLTDATITDGNAVAVEMRATVGLRAGLEVTPLLRETEGRLGPVTGVLRVGGGLEPSPLVAQGADTRLLDADRVLLTGGGGLTHDGPLEVFGRVRWDAFYARNILASGELAPGSGAGSPADGSAIPVGGSYWSAGLQTTVTFR